MPDTILPAFMTFSEEAAVIGRLLAGYTGVELELLLCVSGIRDDFDAVLKAMFRTRTGHIDIADALGSRHYHDCGLSHEFERAISSVRRCTKIRNQYAHSLWWDDRSGALAFANLEEIALGNELVADFSGLPIFHLNLTLLQQQEAFFAYIMNLLIWLSFEARKRAGKPSTHAHAKPKQMSPPPLRIR